MLDDAHRDRWDVEHLPAPAPDLGGAAQIPAATPARHGLVTAHLIRFADLLQPRPRMPRLTAGSASTGAAQRPRRRLGQPIGARRLGRVARTQAQLATQLGVLRLQRLDHRVPLCQRRDHHRELLTQLHDSGGLIGHRAIINIKPLKIKPPRRGGPDQLPTVKLGLHPRYPDERANRDVRTTGIPRWIFRHCSHFPSRNRCRPSPCDRLSRPRSTTAAPPRPGPIGRRWAPPTLTLGARHEGRTGTVPVFTADRSTEEEPSSIPAASPRLPRSTSPWPPDAHPQDRPEVPHQPRSPDPDHRVRTASGPYPPGWSR